MSSSYEVTRQIGEGGIGRVYEAVHRPSGRVVAIKTLRAEHGASSSQRLLLDEAAAAAQLAHPGIVELLDLGRDEQGAMFLVMELVRGSSLESWLTNFPGLATALHAFEEILAALSTAHAQGIVHGDLKPGNVLLTEEGRVKLTDFGIAHVIDPLRRVERRGLQGTPYYMAPEQLVDPASIGPSTDLYAIGVMLYELVTGREPYSTDGTLGDIVARKLATVAPLVARAGVSCPPALVELVLSLLDPNPRTRPRFAARVRGVIAQIAKQCVDARISGGLPRDASTWVDSSIGSDVTIHNTGNVPHSGGSTRSLPFSLPCAEGSAPDVSLHRLRPLPLVGRRAQTQRLLADAAEIAAVGGARGVVVSGRAGEGKTRLVRHGFAEVERTGSMLGVAASFDETIANAEVGLRACMARLLGAPLATLEETIAGPWRWLARVPQPAVDLARIYEWLAAGARALDPAAAADVASMCVLAASRVFPVYLWLDDVGWSRDGAMELFVRLLERDDARVLVVGTLRSGTAEHPAVRAWLLAAAKAGARLEMLPPLDASDRRALVEAAGPVASDVADAIGGRLDEPTLVLVECVRAWIDEGELVPSDRGYVLREGRSAAELVARAASSSRGAVVARRVERMLDGFGEERAHAERVLGHAALLGLRFEERTLRACAGTSGIVDRVLDRALLTGLLRVDGRGAYRFEHRLFLDVVAERCARRPDAHEIYGATADALVATFGPRNTDVSLAVASLHRAAGRRDQAAREAQEAIRSFCRSTLFDAADRAIALLASWIEADALPLEHWQRGLLEKAHGERAYFALDYPTARGFFRRALEIFRASGTASDVHPTLFDISSTYFYADRFLEAERFVAYVESEVADPLAHARGLHRLAEIASVRGDLATAIAYEERSTVLAAGRDPYFEFIAHSGLADLCTITGDVARAADEAARAIAAAERSGDRYMRSDVEHSLAAVEVARGWFAAARRRERARLDDLVTRGDRWQTTATRAIVLLCSAALRDSGAVLERETAELVAAFAEVPHDEPLTWWAMRQAATYLLRGGHPEIARRVSAVLDARLERIARAFEAEAVTEDAAAR